MSFFIAERGIMTQEEIAIKLTDHGNEIGSLKHRMDDVEEQGKAIQNLALSVKELAINMQNMLLEQQSMSSRLTELEKTPSRRWESVVTALIGAVVGAVVTMFL